MRDVRPGREGRFASATSMKQGSSFRADALLASLADLLADGLAPSWLVRVGTRLGGRFPGCNLRLPLGRPALLLEKFGRRLPAILLNPATKETHSVTVDGRHADLRISNRKWASISTQVQVCFSPAGYWCSGIPMTASTAAFSLTQGI